MFALHFLIITAYALLGRAVQVARVSPSPVGDASHMFRHDSYVDKKVRQVAVNLLNHQDYHQRHVILPTFVSNLTSASRSYSDTGVQLQPTSTIPAFTPLHFIRSTSQSRPPLSSTLPSLFLQAGLNSSLGNASTSSNLHTYSITSSNSTNNIGSSMGLMSAPSTVFPNAVNNITSSPSAVSALTPSMECSNVTANVTGGASKVFICTASRYNSSTATRIQPLIPPPLASPYLSRQAIADGLHLATKASLAANTDASWENETDNACSSQLAMFNSNELNPSGILPCYNVHTLDNFTGSFAAELRLYRVDAASGDWTQLRSDGVTVGVAYPDATVSLQNIVKRGELRESRWPMLHAIHPQLRTRAGDTAAKLLQTLSFQGQINNGSVPELSIQAIALALLTPKINLAGTLRNGSPISTQLFQQDAFFLTGIFANPGSNVTGASTMDFGSWEWLSKANSFSAFPLGLCLVAVWCALLCVMEGCELLELIRCRDEDKWRVLAASSGGGMVERKRWWMPE